MLLSNRHLFVPGLLAAVAFASPLLPPAVKLDEALFIGKVDGLTHQFLGIPFAKPPVGSLRFNAPVPVAPYKGVHTAFAFGPACPQQVSNAQFPPLPNATLQFLALLGGTTGGPKAESEDCLTINVFTPTTVRPGAKLPVAVWIYGGGFEGGASSLYDGGAIVRRSIALNEPVIYVSMNYRLSALGFLAGKEVKKAGLGNFGLQDQRLALKWVQKHISAFGGDPRKVTIWGESAGAISVALHLTTNNGNPQGLFRGAFMESGSPPPTSNLEDGQGDYDTLVQKTGCAGSANTLECLRHVDFAVLKKAMDESPSIQDLQSLRLAWLPRVDGKFITAQPMELVQRGSVANVPFVTGDCDDEGTLFSFSTLNITTDQQFRDYIASNYLPHVPDAQVERVLQLYPSDPAQGSPFDTGTMNALSPQFKRMAAFQGDLIFQGPRRFILNHRAAKQKTFAFLSKRFKSVPILGSTHASDLINVYGGGELGDYLIHFVNHGDPNGKTGQTKVAWPRYNTKTPQLLTFLDDATKPVTITADTYRAEGLDLLQDLALKFPI